MIRIHDGSPGDLHALDPFAGPGSVPSVFRCVPTSAALVLGSRQSPHIVNRERCLQAGLEVVTRRSGGGAVLIIPGDVVWIDVVAPRGVLPDDVRASMVMIGQWWCQALIDEGVDAAQLSVHQGGMVSSSWSDLVCFTGIGPGEVLMGDRKVVGLSQRRTRHGVRIQGLVHLRTNLASMVPLFDVAVPDSAPTEPACLPDVDGGALAERLAVQLC